METNHKSAKLPNILITAGLIHIYLGWGFLWLSKMAVKHLNHNAYLGIFAAILFALPLIWIAADFTRLFPGKGFTQIFQQIFGRYLGSLLSTLQVVQGLVLVALAVRESQLMVLTYFFKRTPPFLITAIFLGIALYLALHGIKSIGRLSGFILIPPLTVIYFLLLLGLPNTKLLNAQPFFEGSLKQWFSAGVDLLFVVLPLVALFYYLPFIKDHKSTKQIGHLSLGVIFPLFFLAIFGTIGTFGPELISKMAWPTVEYFHIIDLPILFLEQAGLLFIIAWYAFILSAVAQSLFIISNEINNLFASIKRHWIILASALVVMFFANLPFNAVQMSEFVDRFNLLLITIELIPFVLAWAVARIRSNEVINAV